MTRRRTTKTVNFVGARRTFAKDRRFVTAVAIVFISLSVIGYYIILVIIANSGFASSGRLVTIGSRLLAIMCLTALALRIKKISFDWIQAVFVLFSLLYLFRIFVELQHDVEFHIHPIEMGLYYAGFVYIPFTVLSNIDYRLIDFRLMSSAILVSAIIISVLVITFYWDVLRSGERISHLVARGENYISPLALSYSGALGMGLALDRLTEQDALAKGIIYALIVFVFSLIPFFLGASRGSIVALIATVILIVMSRARKGGKLKLVSMVLVLSTVMVYSAGVMGTKVFDRFLGISSDIENASSSSVRLEIWAASFRQAWDSPIIGGSLETEATGHYPHNIIVEALITTGIVGAIPLLMMLAYLAWVSYKIALTVPGLIWVSIFYIQSLTQSMFSGALYASGWLFVSGALVMICRRRF